MYLTIQFKDGSNDYVRYGLKDIDTVKKEVNKWLKSQKGNISSLDIYEGWDSPYRIHLNQHYSDWEILRGGVLESGETWKHLKRAYTHLQDIKEADRLFQD